MSSNFQPERLTEARQSKGLNMTDLANLVGVTRQAISAFEKGIDAPSSETLLRLSNVLSMPREFFTLEVVGEQRLSSPIFFRSRKTTNKKDREISSVKTKWLIRAHGTLNNYLEFPPVELPDFGILDCESMKRSQIEEYANETRKFFGIGLGPISDLTKLLENRGIPIAAIDVARKIGAFSYVTESGQTFMVTDVNATAVRNRFSLAHELAHLVLHRTLSEDFMEDKELFDLVEKQADYFAGAFLMPSETFAREFYSPNLGALVNMKKRWKVSIGALTYRAHNLKLISDNQKTYVFRQLARYGRRKEPLDDVLEPEKPALLRKAITLLETNKIFSKSDLKERLQIPGSDLAQFFGLDESEFSHRESNVVSFNLKKNTV